MLEKSLLINNLIGIKIDANHGLVELCFERPGPGHLLLQVGCFRRHIN